jgi:hypothetical protein
MVRGLDAEGSNERRYQGALTPTLSRREGDKQLGGGAGGWLEVGCGPRRGSGLRGVAGMMA